MELQFFSGKISRMVMSPNSCSHNYSLQSSQITFSTPLFRAFGHFQQSEDCFDQWQQPEDNYVWTFIWDCPFFSTTKVYKAGTGHRTTHLLFKWLWKAKCQMKYKVFFWLLLKDSINTRDILQRKGMELETQSHANLCILQRLGTVTHLILHCNFAKASWDSIECDISPPDACFRFSRALEGDLESPLH